jgi:hypothetical protein
VVNRQFSPCFWERTKTVKKRLAILAAVPAISLLSIGAAWSQFGGGGTLSPPDSQYERPAKQSLPDAPRPSETFVPRPSDQRPAGLPFVAQPGALDRMGAAMREQAASDGIEQLAGQLREAGDDNKKAYLTAKLKEAVEASFEQDMKDREAELSKVEARLNKLRTQLERRKKAKSEIVQLEVKVLVNEAEGLGFSTVPAQGFGGGKARRRFRVVRPNLDFVPAVPPGAGFKATPYPSVDVDDFFDAPGKEMRPPQDPREPPKGVPATAPQEPARAVPPTLGPAAPPK